MTPEIQTNLGPCCACRQNKPDVRNLLMLHKLAPVPGTGWGNVLLRWPPNGALAVVCDTCLDSDAPLLDAVSGYPAEGGRVPFDSLEGSFGDDAPDEFKMPEPDDPDESRYSMPGEDDDHDVPIVLFNMDGDDNCVGSTELSDDQAAQMLGTPGFTSLSLEQAKELYGVDDEWAKCACVHPDARECYVRRYYAEDLVPIRDEGSCECPCHHDQKKAGK